VLEELEYLISKFGARLMQFRDPNVAVDKGRFAQILEGIIDRRLSIDLLIETDIERLDLDLLYLCKEAGVTQINTGVESGAEVCLQEIGQDVRYLEKVERNVTICNRLGIRVLAHFMVGFANDSWHTVFKTLELAKRLQVYPVFHIMLPYYGTKFREEALAENRVVAPHAPYIRFVEGKSQMATKYLQAEDLELARRLMVSEVSLDRHLKLARWGTLWSRPSPWLLLWARIIKLWVSVKILRLIVARRKKAAAGQVRGQTLARTWSLTSRLFGK